MLLSIFTFLFGAVWKVALFAFFLIALVGVWKHEGLETSKKILWTLGILFLPFLGPLLWFLVGNK